MPVYSPDSLGFVITETARLYRIALEKRIAGAGLDITPSEARALVYVASTDGARQTEIAERMGIEPMTVCGYLDRLEKTGLVYRTPDPRDRRANNVHASEMASRILSGVRAEAFELLEDIQSGLSDAEKDTFGKAMRHVRDRLREITTGIGK